MATRYQVMQPQKKNDQGMTDALMMGGMVAGGLMGGLPGAAAGGGLGQAASGLLQSQNSSGALAAGAAGLGGAAALQNSRTPAVTATPAQPQAPQQPAPEPYNPIAAKYEKGNSEYMNSPTAQLLKTKEALKTASPEVQAQAGPPIDAAIQADKERRMRGYGGGAVARS